jgi:hypothetical protein
VSWWEDGARAESRRGQYDGRDPDVIPDRDEWFDQTPRRLPVLPDDHWPAEPPFGDCA